jgi:hypothetical protein
MLVEANFLKSSLSPFIEEYAISSCNCDRSGIFVNAYNYVDIEDITLYDAKYS